VTIAGIWQQLASALTALKSAQDRLNYQLGMGVKKMDDPRFSRRK
jgi:hypothetical protein